MTISRAPLPRPASAPGPSGRRGPLGSGSVKVLVLGSGAREHALVQALLRDPDVAEVLAAPGNPGIGEHARLLPDFPDLADADAAADAAVASGADLVVVGPEVPLVAGTAEAVRARGVACVGPSAAAAQLEGSKAFAKQVMAAADVPTALAYVCTTDEELAAALDRLGAPHVVKDDGLAAGKGVVVTDDRDEALAHGRACLAGGGTVVIEEYLDGPEASVFCLADGRTVLALDPAQDFKRVGDGDAGANTGGMGAYSPLAWAPADLTDTVLDRVAKPVVAEMARRGTPFSGVLYVGLALTAQGPRVIEFNVRFGDPETQAVLRRLRTPLGSLLHDVAAGTLAERPPLAWDPRPAVTVVLASEGYPASAATGREIRGLADLPPDADVEVTHAGTATGDDGRLLSAGGRVLSVTALGEDLGAARERAYAALAGIGLDGGHHRGDIALAAAQDRVVVPS